MFIEINSLVAKNLGDGKHIEVSWSVVDIHSIQYFTLERYDGHSKKWVPYDGFHGTLKADPLEIQSHPPQRIVVEIDDIQPSNQSFRVRGLSKAGETSDWVSCSTRLEVLGSEYAETTTFFVKNGLQVFHDQGLNLYVTPGVALLGGFRRSIINDIEIRLPDVHNTEYLIYINIDGNVRFTDEIETPIDSIRLAHILVQPNGDIVVTDQRFLWEPEGITTSFDPSLGRVYCLVSWNEIEELNTRGYKIYRANESPLGQDIPPEDSAFELLETVDKKIISHEDIKGMKTNSVYWYQVCAVDYGGTESPRSQKIKFSYILDTIVPSIPQNLTATTGGQEGHFFIDLHWDQNPETVNSYRIYKYDDFHDYFQYYDEVYSPTTTYRYTGAHPRNIYKFAVAAVNRVASIDLQSDLSDFVEVEIGTSEIPDAPVWDLVQPISTGGTEDEIWVTLKWNAVAPKPNGEIKEYRAYLTSSTPNYLLYGKVNAGTTEMTIPISASFRGMEHTFTLMTVDIWGNQSEYSQPFQTISVGGKQPKIPEFQLSLDESSSIPRVIVDIDNVYLDIEDDPVNVTEFLIYRGPTSIQLKLIDRVAMSELAKTEWIDQDVFQGRTYYYTVVSITDTGTRSSMLASGQEIKIPGDFIQPPDYPVINYDLSGTQVEGQVITNYIEFTPPQEDYSGIFVYRSTTLSFYSQIQWIPKESIIGDTYRFEHTENIVNGQSYYYVLTAKNNTLENSLYDAPATAKINISSGDITKPVTPTGFASEMMTESIILTWNNVIDCSGYKIFRSSINPELLNTFEEIVNITDPNIVTFEDFQVIHGHTYWYYIISYNNLGVSSILSSTIQQEYEITEIINAPLDLTYSMEFLNSTSVHIGLSWATVINAEEYEVYRTINGITRSLGITQSGSFEDTVSYGQQVVYKIRAITALNNKSEFTSISINAIRGESPSIVPFTLSHSQQADNLYTLDIEWSEYVADNYFKEYRVYYRKELQTAVVVNSITDNNLKYIQKSIFSGINYSFGITCVDIFGNESELILQDIIVEDNSVPQPPTNLVVNPGLLSFSLTWDAPTKNEGDTNLVNLQGYNVYEKEGVTYTLVAMPLSTSALFNVGGNVTKTYVVTARNSRVESVYSNESTATSMGIEGGSFDLTPPDSVDTPVFIDAGIDVSTTDNTEDVWIEFSWTAVPGAAKYYIYLDGQYAGQTNSTKTSFKAKNLYSKESYEVQVSTINDLGIESAISSSLTAYTGQTSINPSIPTLKQIKSHIGALTLFWDEPNETHIDGYKIEFATVPTGQPAENLTWEVATEKCNLDFFTHPRLDYRLDYYYKIKTLDTFGKESEFTSIIGPATPAKTGSDDVDDGALFATHLRAGEVTTEHLRANSVNFEKMAGDSVRVNHIQSGAVTAEKLTVTLGGRNFVKNSAFGMEEFDGDLGVDWIGIDGIASVVDKTVDIDIPVQEHALRFHTLTNDSCLVSQELNIPTDVEEITISFHYTCSEDLISTGDQGFYVYLTDSNGVIGNKIELYGNEPWTREKATFELPSTQGITLNLDYSNTTGTILVTGIMIEEGDIATQWFPIDGETYGASGNVQINTRGIKISNGNLQIETDGNSVIIDGDGILAGSGSKLALMNHNGFSSVGGSFSVLTGTKEDEGVVINSSGIKAYCEKNPSVEITTQGVLNLYNGRFNILSSSDGNNGVIFDSSGLTAKKDGVPTVEINNDGEINITGSFSITSPDLEVGNHTKMELTQDHISYVNAAGDLVFKASNTTGDVLMGKNLKMSSTGFNANGEPMGGERLQVSMDEGIFYETAQGDRTFELDIHGSAKFKDIEISSATGNLTIQHDGIVLGDIFDLSSAGAGSLTISNATITDGDITLNDLGMTIDGESGIFVNNINEDPMVEINNTGIRLLQGSALVIDPLGSISFGENLTAIDSSGVHAESISTGKLSITGDKDDLEGAYISVDDKVTIDKSGITIHHGGAFTLESEGQNAIIKDGKISAQALEIGVIGSNLLKNGQANFDFPLRYWNPTVGGTSVARKETRDEAPIGPAGVSGKYAFKIATSSIGKGIEQIVEKAKRDSEHSISAQVYVYNGSFQIKVSQKVNDVFQLLKSVTVGTTTGDDYVGTGWKTVTGHSFKTLNNTEEIKIEIISTTDTALIYITDIGMYEGALPLRQFSPHPSEVFTDDDSGNRVSIGHGNFQIVSADGDLEINQAGISLTKGEHSLFALNSDGLAISFNTKDIKINEDKGIIAYKTVNGVRDETKSVQINEDGITVTGGQFSLISNGSTKQEFKIDETGLYATDDKELNNNYIRINYTDGIDIRGTSEKPYFKITSNDSDKIMEIGSSQISVSRTISGQLKKVVEIGETSKSESGYGISITDGSFHLSSEAKAVNSMTITEKEISMALSELKGDTQGDIYSCKLTPKGLQVFRDGNLINSVFENSVEISNQVIYSGQLVAFKNNFIRKPHVLVLPYEFMSSDGSTDSMRVRAYPKEVTSTSFIPVVDLYIPDQELTSTSPTWYSGTHTPILDWCCDEETSEKTWITETDEPGVKFISFFVEVREAEIYEDCDDSGSGGSVFVSIDMGDGWSSPTEVSLGQRVQLNDSTSTESSLPTKIKITSVNPGWSWGHFMQHVEVYVRDLYYTKETSVNDSAAKVNYIAVENGANIIS